MIKGCSNLTKLRIIILAVVCLSVTVFWPAWRADLRAQNGNGYDYGYDYGYDNCIDVKVVVDPCIIKKVPLYKKVGLYIKVTVINNKDLILRTVDTGSISVSFADKDGNVIIADLKPTIWWITKRNNLDLYINLADLNISPDAPFLQNMDQNTEITVAINGDTLNDEYFCGSDTISAEDVAKCGCGQCPPNGGGQTPQ